MRPGAGLPHPAGAVRRPPPLEAEPEEAEKEGLERHWMFICLFACCVLLDLGEQNPAASRTSEDPTRNNFRACELFPLPIIVMIASRSEHEIVVDGNRVLKLWVKIIVQLVNLLI